MKNRVIALLLALLTLLSVCLVGCGEEEEDPNNIEAASSREPITLSMWVITDESTTEEAMDAVEAAFDSYTKSNFTTSVDLVFVTKDEYENALSDYYRELGKYRASIAATTTTAPVTEEGETEGESETVEETTAETFVNQYGVQEIKFPEPAEYQLDILLILGDDMYYKYANSGMLKSMSTTLLDVSKKLSDYIYPTFLDAAKISSGTWAIPNNHAIGEYTYLLINRELAEKYYIDTDDITSVEDCLPFLSDVHAKENIPAVKAPFECPNIKFWSADGSFSVLASDYTTDIQPKNIFEIESYVSYLETTALFEEKGYYAADPNTDSFGIGVVKGSAADAEKYAEDYVVKVLEYPLAESDDLLAASFGVCAYSEYFDRAMEVIVALNTSEELRNILQYGVQDVTYKMGEDGNVESLMGNYSMDLLYTGNAFVAYNAPGVTDEDIAAQKKQNLDSVMSPYLALSEKNDIDAELYTALDEYSADVAETLDGCNTRAAMTSAIARLAVEVAENEAFIAATDAENANSVVSVCAKIK